MGKTFNIYMTGVGGQGIGLLAELLARAADKAGLEVKGSDTHGLAQRGGIVASHLRIGPGTGSPLVEAGRADLVVALERNEALRALRNMLARGGVLLWYDAAWQPLDVRLGKSEAVTAEELLAEAAAVGARARKIFRDGLSDPRQQNMVLVADIAAGGLIPGVGLDHYRAALADLLDGSALERNLAVLEGRG